MSRSRGATSQKAGFNPSFIYSEFATIKNQAGRSSHPARVGLAPGATAEEFSVVLREVALYLALENCDPFRKNEAHCVKAVSTKSSINYPIRGASSEC